MTDRAMNHVMAAYVVGGLTLAMLVTFAVLDLQAVHREAGLQDSAHVIDSITARGAAARPLVASD